ncbi:hypothetical protein COUCH_15470 [Couchioplanes caeruleus]|uniref:NucA/NucB deoxyribonuclease domain-containing protein n=1 Tax=Couchioplanes caeruleus TaxID=56438 RepID=UPI0020BEA960|nr:hypothetical protein [Couchioplanes caeruleus]UQU67580.1 hypothetical protein COUCH_15470 [Couchioplanes caeruleus]
MAPRVHPDGLTISGQALAGTHELATLGSGDESVAMSYTGNLPDPLLDGDKAIYPEVKTGIDLVVQATVTGVESFFIVKNRKAAAQVGELTVPITGVDVASHRLTNDGRLTLLDEDRNVLASTPAPLMWDSRTDPDTGDPLAVRTMGISATAVAARDTSIDAEAVDGAGVKLTIEPDAAFLKDPRTVYPVTIDPTVHLGAPVFDTWVRDGVTEDLSTRTYLEIGLRDGKVSRAFVNFDTAAFKGKKITDATVVLGNYLSASCNIYYQVGTVTAPSTASRWTSQPTWRFTDGQSNESWGGPTGCSTVQPSSVKATSFFQRASDEGRDVAYLGVRAVNEASSSSQKRFYSMEYNGGAQAPGAVVTYAYQSPILTARATESSSQCLTGTSRPVLNTLTPELSATFTDVDSTATDATFEYQTVSGTPVGTSTVAATATGTRAAVTVEQDLFTSEQSYRWRVMATDSTGMSSGWSAWCEFTIRANFASPTVESGPVETYTEPTDPSPMPVEGEDEVGVDETETEDWTPATSDALQDTPSALSFDASPTATVASADCDAGSGASVDTSFSCTHVSKETPTDSIDVSDVVSQQASAAGTSVTTPVGKLGNTPLPDYCKTGVGQWKVTRTSACWFQHVETWLWTVTKNGMRLDGKIFYDAYRYTRMSQKGGTVDYHVYLRVTGFEGLATGVRAANVGMWCNQTCAKVEVQKSSPSLDRIGKWVQFSGTFRPPVSAGTRAARYATMEYYVGRTKDQKKGWWHPSSNWIRCDRDTKTVTASLGCVVPNYIPTLKYSKSGPYPELARHIGRAQDSGLPGEPGAGVLDGEPGTSNALNRVYSPTFMRKNRAKACSSDIKIYKTAGNSCDEYPFASTWQGAYTQQSGTTVAVLPRTQADCGLPPETRFGSYGYSRCYIDENQNSNGGGMLGKFYSASESRILNGDKFFVKIVA